MTNNGTTPPAAAEAATSINVEELFELLDTPAPSGYERPAAEVFCRIGRTFTDDVRTDAIGNAIVTVNAGAGPRVMLGGHLDEIGFVVTKVEATGQLRFGQVGGWDPAVPVGQRVRILTADGEIAGALGRRPPHQIPPGERNVELKDLWVDIAARDRDHALELVRPGDPMVIDASPVRIGEHHVMSRSVDNRLGCYVALEVARRAVGLGVEVVAVGTVSEETNQIGALTSAYGLEPWRALVVDSTPANDVPGDGDGDMDLGKGPAVTFGASTRSAIGSQLLAVAETHGIDVQIEAAGRSTNSDADEVVTAGAGVVTGLLSVPTRYLHTPVELFDLRDAEAAIDLAVHWLRDVCQAGD